jgi:hypothetical protein
MTQPYKILSPNGNRLAVEELRLTNKAYGIGYYATPLSTAQSQYYRPRFYVSGKIEDMSTPFRWEYVSLSIQFFCQLGNVASAIQQKATYAVGDAWRPHFTGSNRKWGEIAENWLLNQWYLTCDGRGEIFDFTTNLWIDSIALDVVGDSLMILYKTDDGYPQIKILPGVFITNNNEKEIKQGLFKGKRLVNGCVLNDENRVIGYQLQGIDEGFYYYVSTFDCQLLYEPVWHNQYRGVPKLATAILDWADLQDVDQYLKRALKLDSSIGLIKKTETGPNFTEDIFGQPISTPSSVAMEYLSGGEIYYLNPRLGETLEPFTSNRPHPNQSDFIYRIERRAILALDWFPDLLDPSRIGGASTRLIQDQARAVIKRRQKTLRKRALRAVRYAIAVAIKNGLLPQNDEDWYMWDFDMPALLTVDAGYDAEADLNALRLGLTTEAAINAKYGKNWIDTRNQRKVEIEKVISDAKEIADKHGISPETALQLLENLNIPIQMEQTQQEETQNDKNMVNSERQVG